MHDLFLLNGGAATAPVVEDVVVSPATPKDHRRFTLTLNDGIGQRLLLLIAGALAVIFALRVVGRADKALLIWPVTGLALALCLPSWEGGWKKRISLSLPIGVGVFIGGLAVGQTAWLAFIIAMLTCIDLIVAGSILSPHVRCFDDLKQRNNMLRFVVASIAAPMLTGLLGAVPVSIFIKGSLLQTAVISTLANSLGIAVILPAALFLISGEYRSFSKLAPYARGAALSGVPFIAISAAIFWQTRGPFLFIVFPPMIAVLLVLGLEGAVLTSVSLTAIGWIATLHGHGPIMLMRGATPEFRMLVLQIFIWVCIATAMPVGALIDERKRAMRSAEESRSIYELLMQHTQDAIVLSTVDGSRRYVSPAIEKLTGWTPAEYAMKDRQDIVHPDDRDIVPMLQESLTGGKREHEIRYRIMHKDRSWRWVEATIRGYGTDEIAGYVGTIRDISVLKENEDSRQRDFNALEEEKQRLARLAHIDPLTGLLNRRGLDDMLRQQRNLGRRRLAVLMIDVDHFKLYNDTYGHQAGDACLVSLAKTLKTLGHRDCDLVARMGGEEFAILLPDTDEAGAMVVAEEIRRTLAAIAMEHKASPLGAVSVSIGVSSKISRARMDLSLLLSQADRALYRSKHEGRNRATAFGRTLELVRA